MFLAKLKTVIGTSFIAVALGVGGLIYNAELVPGGARAADEAKPKSELEMLRRENELLKMNLRVTLEKIIAQNEELKKLKERLRIDRRLIEGLKLESGVGEAAVDLGKTEAGLLEQALKAAGQANQAGKLSPAQAAEVDAALKALYDRKDKGSREETLNQLEELIRKLKAGEQKQKPPTEGSRPEGKVGF